MVKLRLSQTGTKNRKTYRIVAIEEGKRRDGRAIEVLGFYNPLVKPPMLTVDKERLEWWQAHGAQLSPSLSKLLHHA